MRLLVCGGRDYDDRAKMFEVLDGLLIEHDVETLIHGGWPGADALAGEWARARGVEQIICAAFWMREAAEVNAVRKALGLLMDAEEALAVSFPGGWGTAMLVGGARAMGIRVIEVEQYGAAWRRIAPEVSGRIWDA